MVYSHTVQILCTPCVNAVRNLIITGAPCTMMPRRPEPTKGTRDAQSRIRSVLAVGAGRRDEAGCRDRPYLCRGDRQRRCRRSRNRCRHLDATATGHQRRPFPSKQSDRRRPLARCFHRPGRSSAVAWLGMLIEQRVAVDRPGLVGCVLVDYADGAAAEPALLPQALRPVGAYAEAIDGS